MVIGIDASRVDIKNKTGTEYYSYNLIKHLLKIDKVNRYILYSRHPLSKEFKKITPNFINKVLYAPRLWTQLRLSLEMLKASPDALFIPAHTIPWIHPKKTIVTIHGLEYEYFPGAYSFFKRCYLRWATKRALKWAKKIIVPSESTKRDLIKFYQANSEKVKIVYHGFSQLQECHCEESLKGQQSNPETTTLSVKSRDCFARPFGLARNDKNKYILFIGRLERRKNLIRLIQAFNLLKRKFNISHKLILAGKAGFGFQEIKTTIQNSSYKKDIFLKGYVSEEEKNNLLKNADVFVFPSLYEGFGMPILEAMASGIPVVCSNVSSLPEIAGDAALLVNPLDVDEISEAIYKLLTDEKLKEEMIKKGLENIKRFSWEKCARETLKVLEEAGKNGCRPELVER